MPTLHRLYKAGQATIVHATATPYRERSHFDGQDVLENGLPKPGSSETGWLNRALGAIEAGGRVDPRGAKAFAVGPVTPLVVRGSAPVHVVGAATAAAGERRHRQCRLLDLYSHTDPALARALEARRGLMRAARAGGMDTGAAAGPATPRGIAARARLFRGGGRHRGEAIWRGRTARASARWALSAGTRTSTRAPRAASSASCSARSTARLPPSRPTWASAWRETVVAIVTEFGRTARLNGNDGTDHGTATTALLIGGALKGGRVIADWPGLKPHNLHEGRDLKPTTDLRAVLKGVAQGPRAGGGCGARQRRVPGQRRRQADGRPLRLTLHSRTPSLWRGHPGAFPLQWPARSRLYARSRSGRERKYQGCGLPGTFTRSV